MKKIIIFTRTNLLFSLFFLIGLISVFGDEQAELKLLYPPAKESKPKDALFFEDQNANVNLTFTIKSNQRPEEIKYLQRSNQRWSSSLPITFCNWNEKSALCCKKLASGIPMMIVSGDNTNYDKFFNLPEYLNEEQTVITDFSLEGLNNQDIYNIVLNNKRFFYSFQINGKWIEPKEVPETSNSMNPRLAIGENENALILFSKDTDGNYITIDSELFISLFRNNCWSKPVQISEDQNKYKMNAQAEYAMGDYIVLWTFDSDGDLATADDIKIAYLAIDKQAKKKNAVKQFEYDANMSVPVLGKFQDDCFFIFASPNNNNGNESGTLKSIYFSRYHNMTFTEAIDTGLVCSEFYNPKIFNVGDHLFLTYIDTGKLRIAMKDVHKDKWYACQSLFHFNHFNIDFSQCDYFIDKNALFHLALIGAVSDKSSVEKNNAYIQSDNEVTQSQEGIYYTEYRLLPDLTVNLDSTEPRSKKVNSAFNLSFRITNCGYLTSGEYHINVIQNGNKIKEIAGQPLGPNESCLFTETMQMIKPELDYRLEVVTGTEEVSVQNNQIGFSVQVLPDYAVESVIISENNITVEITSQKDTAAPSVPLDLYCQVGNELKKITTVIYNPNVIEPVIINWPDLSRLTDEFRIIAEVNADRKIREDTYLNNKASYSFKPLPDFLIGNADLFEEKIVVTLENQGSAICPCNEVEFYLVSELNLLERANDQNNGAFYFYQSVSFQEKQNIKVEIDTKDKLNSSIDKLYAVINPHRRVDERSQNNNIFSFSVNRNMLSDPDDRYLLKFSEAKRIDNTVWVGLKNIGNKPIISARVSLYNSSDELIGTKIIPVIKTKEAGSVYFKQAPKDSYLVKVNYKGPGNKQNEISHYIPYSFLVEAETLKLCGYYIEENESASGGQLVRTNFWGSLLYDFNNEKDGSYDIYITYYDENDGASSFIVNKNHRVIDMWRADERTPSDLACKETRVIRIIKNVKMKQGDKLLISTIKNRNEYARIDCIEFIDAGRSYYIPDNDKAITIEAEDIIKKNFTVEAVQDASNRKIAMVDGRGKGTLSYRSKLEPGFYEIQITYYDLNYGKSEYALSIDGKAAVKWTADKRYEKSGFDSFCEDTKTTVTIDGVYISRDAEIILTGVSDQHDKANFDAIIFRPSFDTRENCRGYFGKGGKK